ncbi:hypothetical protein ACJMK2_005598, partial [Sinanodonta woodiana]
VFPDDEPLINEINEIITPRKVKPADVDFNEQFKEKLHRDRIAKLEFDERLEQTRKMLNGR